MSKLENLFGYLIRLEASDFRASYRICVKTELEKMEPVDTVRSRRSW